MIVRILGDGRYDVPDDHRSELDTLDDELGEALDGGDDEIFATALSAIIATVRQYGRTLPMDELSPSDLLLPFDDATCAETRDLLAGEAGSPTG